VTSAVLTICGLAAVHKLPIFSRPDLIQRRLIYARRTKPPNISSGLCLNSAVSFGGQAAEFNRRLAGRIASYCLHLHTSSTFIKTKRLP